MISIFVHETAGYFNREEYVSIVRIDTIEVAMMPQSRIAVVRIFDRQPQFIVMGRWVDIEGSTFDFFAITDRIRSFVVPTVCIQYVCSMAVPHIELIRSGAISQSPSILFMRN